MNIWIYQDAVVVDETPSDVLASASSFMIPASASSISVVSVDPQLRVLGVQIEPAPVEVAAVTAGGKVYSATGIIIEQDKDGVKLYGKSGPGGATQVLTIRSPILFIKHGDAAQRVRCRLEGPGNNWRLGYRMPAVSWQFQHDIVVLVDKGKAVLTSNVRLAAGELAALAKGPVRLNFTTKSLDVIQRNSYSSRPTGIRREIAETMAAPRDITVDAFGSWTVEQAHLERFCDSIFPVAQTVLEDVRYHLAYVVTNNFKGEARSPGTHLDLSSDKTREKVAAVEKGRLTVRLSPSHHLVGDSFTLEPTSQQIDLGTLETLKIEERLVREDHDEHWREVQLTITNKSTEAPPVPLHIWHQEASSVLVRLDEEGVRWSDPYRAQILPIHRTTACIFPVQLQSKKRITHVVFRWFLKQ